jgi:RHS repeat-associated protein
MIGGYNLMYWDNVVAITNVSPATVVSYDDYDGWGMILEGRSAVNGDGRPRFKFTGKERDAESKYDYFGARYYDSRVGRWMSVDPLAERNPHLSPFNYVSNNPVVRLDLRGLSDITIHIRRIRETANSTIGILTVTNSANSSSLAGFTLELPDRNNRPNESRILAGTYDAQRTTRDAEHDHAPTIRLEDRNDRTNILMHPGNTADDTQGCILSGTTAGEDRVNNSTLMQSQVIEHVDAVTQIDRANGEQTNIRVQIVDTSPIERMQPRTALSRQFNVPSQLPQTPQNRVRP